MRLFDCHDFDTAQDFQKTAEFFSVSFVVAIHLHRAGRLTVTLGRGVRIFFVAGGTDLNECVKLPLRFAEMTNAVEKAEAIVFFSPQMQHLFANHFPKSSAKEIVIFPAVSPAPEPDDWALNCPHFRKPFFLLPAGIRNVKAPEYLIDCVECRGKESLIICGPILSQETFSRLENKLSGKKRVFYVGNLSAKVLHFLMGQNNCAAVINCSESEGLANSILESFSLKCPVAARNILGNLAIIKEGKNGILFGSPEEFSAKIDQVYQIDRSQIEPLNCVENERIEYQELLIN